MRWFCIRLSTSYAISVIPTVCIFTVGVLFLNWNFKSHVMFFNSFHNSSRELVFWRAVNCVLHQATGPGPTTLYVSYWKHLFFVITSRLLLCNKRISFVEKIIKFHVER